VRWSSRRYLGLLATFALLSATTACFPTPSAQHAVWRRGRFVEGQFGPLPAVGPHVAESGETRTGISWPGLGGGRFGYGTDRFRAGIGAFIGLALYGDASLTVRLLRVGRVHTAIAAEGGYGAAALTSAAVLGDLVGEPELSGAFGWGRLRPLVTIGPSATSGRGLTLGGSYGSFAGVRERGFSIGGLFLGGASGNTRVEKVGAKSWLRSETVEWGAFSVDVNVLWHGELSTPTVLLTLSVSGGQETVDSKLEHLKRR